MPTVQKPQPRRYVLLLFEGFSNLCLANAVEPLRAANTLARKRLYSWEFVGMAAGALASSSGLTVQAGALRDERGDCLLVMPGYGHDRLATPATLRGLRAAAGRFDLLVGLDTGAWLLAQAGLLTGHRATAHWDILADLAERFPEIEVTEDRFVLSGDRASCGGATTTLDLMLALIARDHGTPLALEVAALFMHGERPPHLDPARLIPPHGTVRAAAAIMRRHVEAPLPVAAIAARLGLSQRALEAVFAREAGRGPARLYRAIRLAEGRRRMEQGQSSVAEVASRCGYADATAFSRAFRAEFGLSPRAARLAASRG